MVQERTTCPRCSAGWKTLLEFHQMIQASWQGVIRVDIHGLKGAFFEGRVAREIEAKLRQQGVRGYVRRR